MLLDDYLQKAGEEKWAVPHFNIASLEQLKAIIATGLKLNSPLHVGLSESERKYFGDKQAVALINAFQSEYPQLPIFLNADHCKSVESAKKAIDAGFDSIHIDLSALEFDENVKGTKEIVEYAKSKSTSISVEGELGYLRGESKMQKEKIFVI
ncbi:MAG: class II fructose-bisphosphate aldolase [Candidatus Paceibacteria bacterium]